MEAKSPFPLDVLEFKLENRKEFIDDHDEEMRYICSCLSHYPEDVKHVIETGISHSAVSHLTYNLILVIAKGLTSLTIYEYLCGAYLLGDNYDNVYEFWKSASDSVEIITPLLAKLDDENYFDEDIDVEEFFSEILPPHCEKLRGAERLLNLQRRVSLRTGNSLLYSLNCNLRFFVQLLFELKMGIYNDIEEEYERVYEANYNLYRQEYWPIEGKNFRQHIEDNYFRGRESKIDVLERLLRDERYDFEKNIVGSLWRDYYDDKKTLYFEIKKRGLDDDQWKYFFKYICRFEEYERWIDELSRATFPIHGLKTFVVKQEIAEAVIEKITGLIDIETRPKPIVRPVRAAMDAGVLHRPSWDAFVDEYGRDKIKSAASFNSYTNPEQEPYTGESYQALVNDFKHFLE